MNVSSGKDLCQWLVVFHILILSLFSFVSRHVGHTPWPKMALFEVTKNVLNYLWTTYGLKSTRKSPDYQGIPVFPNRSTLGHFSLLRRQLWPKWSPFGSPLLTKSLPNKIFIAKKCHYFWTNSLVL